MGTGCPMSLVLGGVTVAGLTRCCWTDMLWLFYAQVEQEGKQQASDRLPRLPLGPMLAGLGQSMQMEVLLLFNGVLPFRLTHAAECNCGLQLPCVCPPTGSCHCE